MIIFNLDGTLADCEHRRHFVDVADFESFYEAFDKDTPIEAVCKIFDDLAVDNDIQIWSCRCESIRQKTLDWLYNYVPYSSQILKMRPIGDNTPYHELKEKWLDEYINSNEYVKNVFQNRGKSPIHFVFDSDHESIKMWRRRGVFVFDCNQGE